MYDYELLRRIAELYEEADLEDTLLIACQHLLGPQQRMFELLLAAGLRPRNCVIIGKNYSTNASVMRNLQNAGCIVAPFSDEFEPQRLFRKWFEERLIAFVRAQFEHRRIEDYKKVVILDDGGHLHCVMDALFPLADNIIGIEQTSSGHHKIQEADIRFPVVSVARSYHKLHLESPYIGEIGVLRIMKHLMKRGKHDPNVLVMGLGPIGRQIAGRLFVDRMLRGFATDVRHFDPRVRDTGAFQLLQEDRRIISTDRAYERIGEFDVVIGAVGKPILEDRDVSRLHPAASLISVSSSDHEFPPLPFRHENTRVHDDCLLEGRCLANAGFPITFNGNLHEIPPRQIELTMALLMTHVMDQAGGHKRHVPYVIEQLVGMWKPDLDAKEWYAEVS